MSGLFYSKKGHCGLLKLSIWRQLVGDLEVKDTCEQVKVSKLDYQCGGSKHNIIVYNI